MVDKQNAAANATSVYRQADRLRRNELRLTWCIMAKIETRKFILFTPELDFGSRRDLQCPECDQKWLPAIAAGDLSLMTTSRHAAGRGRPHTRETEPARRVHDL